MAMRVRRSRSIHVSFEAAGKVLCGDAAVVLCGGDGEPCLGVEVFGVHVEHPIRLETRPCETVEQPIRATVLAFRIEASDHVEWFPMLEGDIEVTPTGGGVEVALEAEYHVPGGALGAAVDRVGLHRVADESIDHFFDGVVSRLQEGAGAIDALTGVPV
jgi:hypothetical protein